MEWRAKVFVTVVGHGCLQCNTTRYSTSDTMLQMGRETNVFVTLCILLSCCVILYYAQVWSRTKTLQYRCVDDVVRYRQVTFMCDNGDTRSHRIRVVRSCKCKRYSAADNRVTGSRGRSRGRRTTRQRKRQRSDRRSAAASD